MKKFANLQRALGLVLSRVLTFLLCFCLSGAGQAQSLYQINLGAAANDRTGTSLRQAGGMINSNFTTLFNLIEDIEVGSGSGETNVLGDASNSGVSLVGPKLDRTNTVKRLKASGS